MLAVIVILAIIALIITPIVTGIIKKAKDSADLRSAEAYVKAGENYFAKASTSGGALDTNVIDNLEVSSTPAEDGSDFVVGSDGSTDMAIIINDKCYRKTFSDGVGDIAVTDVVTDEDRKDCNVPLKSDYAFLDKDLFLKNSYISRVVSVQESDTIPSSYAYSADFSDATIEGNASIMAYYVPTVIDSDTYFNVYLVSSKPIAAPEDSSYLFFRADLRGGVNLSWLHTYFVTNMANMFGDVGLTGMTSLSLGDNFDTSNVTDMSSMFYVTGDGPMISLNLGDKFDTSNVINMNAMFWWCGRGNLLSLDLGDKFDTSKVTDMSYMFWGLGVSKLESLDLGDKFDTSNATQMNSMFKYMARYSTSFVSFDLGDKFDTSKAEPFSSTFQWCCSSMTSLDLGPKFEKFFYDDYSNIPVDAFSPSGCEIKVSSKIFYDSKHFKTTDTNGNIVPLPRLDYPTTPTWTLVSTY